MESLVGDQALQVPDVENRAGRQSVFVSHEKCFKDKVYKTGCLPEEQPKNSLPAIFKEVKTFILNNPKFILNYLPEADDVSLVAPDAGHLAIRAVPPQKCLNLKI